MPRDPAQSVVMFDTLISDTQAFVTQLAANNTREWFQANKSTYEDKLRAPALELLDHMAPKLEALTGFSVTPKLFRIHRDVRFSKDKTPYKPHLHMLWWVEAGARQNPALFFGIDRDKVTAGTGIFAFEKEVLADWRKMVDLDGDHIAARIRPTVDKGYPLRDPALKRVPPPYTKDHPHAALLRHKGLVAAGPPELTGDLPEGIEAAFEDLWPVADMLIGVAETPTL